jgi:hypothetical protein
MEPHALVIDTRPASTTFGNPLVGAKIYVYTTGTSTPQPVYTDSALSIAWTQPIVTNSSGQSNGAIYVTSTPSLKVDIQDSSGVSLPNYPVDPWTPGAVGV